MSNEMIEIDLTKEPGSNSNQSPDSGLEKWYCSQVTPQSDEGYEQFIERYKPKCIQEQRNSSTSIDTDSSVDGFRAPITPPQKQQSYSDLSSTLSGAPITPCQEQQNDTDSSNTLAGAPITPCQEQQSDSDSSSALSGEPITPPQKQQNDSDSSNTLAGAPITPPYFFTKKPNRGKLINTTSSSFKVSMSDKKSLSQSCIRPASK